MLKCGNFKKNGVQTMSYIELLDKLAKKVEAEAISKKEVKEIVKKMEGIK